MGNPSVFLLQQNRYSGRKPYGNTLITKIDFSEVIMFLKSLASILIVTSSFILAIGQTPEPKQEKERAARAFAFAFAGDGGYLGVQSTEVDRDNYTKYGLREVRGVAVER